MKINKIVLATDFSEDAERPLAPVNALAKSTGAEVDLLHAILTLTQPVGSGRAYSPVAQREYEEERKTSVQALEKLAERFDVPTSHSVVTGTNVAKAITDYAKEANADLLALSTHGRTGFRRLIMGSIAEEVLRKSEVPVLCFPKQEAGDTLGTKLEHILITTDLSKEALRPFDPVFELAQSLGCRVTVLHIVPALQAIPYGAPLAPPVSPPDLSSSMESARTTVKKQCSPVIESLGDNANINIEVLSHTDAAKGIVEFAAKNDIDLIALSSHGRTGIRRAALGSVAEQVIRHSPVPVLSFHRTKE